jgi:hypothetical protein
MTVVLHVYASSVMASQMPASFSRIALMWIKVVSIVQAQDEEVLSFLHF